MLPHSSRQVGVSGHYVRHDTYIGVLMCKSRVAKEFESSAPLQGPPPGVLVEDSDSFAGSRLGGQGKPDLWPSFSGQSDAHGTERWKESLQEERRSCNKIRASQRWQRKPWSARRRHWPKGEGSP